MPPRPWQVPSEFRNEHPFTAKAPQGESQSTRVRPKHPLYRRDQNRQEGERRGCTQTIGPLPTQTPRPGQHRAGRSPPTSPACGSSRGKTEPSVDVEHLAPLAFGEPSRPSGIVGESTGLDYWESDCDGKRREAGTARNLALADWVHTCRAQVVPTNQQPTRAEPRPWCSVTGHISGVKSFANPGVWFAPAEAEERSDSPSLWLLSMTLSPTWPKRLAERLESFRSWPSRPQDQFAAPRTAECSPKPLPTRMSECRTGNTWKPSSPAVDMAGRADHPQNKTTGTVLPGNMGSGSAWVKTTKSLTGLGGVPCSAQTGEPVHVLAHCWA